MSGMSEEQILENLLRNNRLPFGERRLLPNETVRYSLMRKVLSEILSKQLKLPKACTAEELGENCQIEKIKDLYRVRKSSEVGLMTYKILWEKEFSDESRALDFYIKEQFKEHFKSGVKINWDA